MSVGRWWYVAVIMLLVVIAAYPIQKDIAAYLALSKALTVFEDADVKPPPMVEPPPSREEIEAFLKAAEDGSKPEIFALLRARDELAEEERKRREMEELMRKAREEQAMDAKREEMRRLARTALESGDDALRARTASAVQDFTSRFPPELRGVSTFSACIDRANRAPNVREEARLAAVCRAEWGR